jgi:hypothetical protein
VQDIAFAEFLDGVGAAVFAPRMVATRCHEWLLSMLGVLWSQPLGAVLYL